MSNQSNNDEELLARLVREAGDPSVSPDPQYAETLTGDDPGPRGRGENGWRYGRAHPESQCDSYYPGKDPTNETHCQVCRGRNRTGGHRHSRLLAGHRRRHDEHRLRAGGGRFGPSPQCYLRCDLGSEGRKRPAARDCDRERVLLAPSHQRMEVSVDIGHNPAVKAAAHAAERIQVADSSAAKAAWSRRSRGYG